MLCPYRSCVEVLLKVLSFPLKVLVKVLGFFTEAIHCKKGRAIL